MTSSINLFEKYGGIKTIASVVHDFYDDILADPSLSPLFAGVNMNALIEHQVVLLSQYLGGPAGYQGRSLEQAHSHMAISNEQFDRVAEHLANNLTDHGVEPADLATILEIVAATRSDIVNE